jgi:7-cyano-7-deazaguanine synthase
MKPKAIVLFSGGIDSTTVLAIARDRGFAVHTLSFCYGQAHAAELEAAGQIARAMGIPRRVIPLNLWSDQDSALLTKGALPEQRTPEAMQGGGIPLTYVPARNTVFLAFALAHAETIGARDLFLGANAQDQAGYPDCRPRYFAAFERVANLGTKAGVEGDAFRIHNPLMGMDKAGIIAEGARLGVDYSLTVSCYRADLDGLACGGCDACVLRRDGFTRAGLADLTRYQKVST